MAARRRAADDLASLSDEFDNPQTLSNWKRVFEEERTGADQLASLDIGKTRDGWLTLVPHASTWYQDYRGVLVHKLSEGRLCRDDRRACDEPRR